MDVELMGGVRKISPSDNLPNPGKTMKLAQSRQRLNYRKACRAIVGLMAKVVRNAQMRAIRDVTETYVRSFGLTD